MSSQGVVTDQEEIKRASPTTQSRSTLQMMHLEKTAVLQQTPSSTPFEETSTKLWKIVFTSAVP